jgi:diguanylate cyclase (GGDEF)-like protein
LFLINLLATIILPPEYSLSSTNSAVKTIHFGNFQEITYYEAELGIIYQIEIILALITYMYYLFLFIRYYQKTHYKILLLILACLSTYFFGVLNDSLVALRVYSFIYISEYSFFFIILGMAYTLLVKFIDLHKSNEELNVTLEHKVSERTIEIQKLNEDLKRLVDYDGLTGAYNRRFFNEYIDIEVKRANNWVDYKTQLEPDIENEMNFGSALIDIDQFKRINDTYGHLVGDRVLIQIVKIMQSCIFTRDVLCRYGGDEFALLLTKTSRDGIFQAAEKIRDGIDRHAFILNESHTNEHITISVGLVIFDEVPHRGSEETLKLADDRLLRAKRSGRNRIVYDES